MKLPGIIGRGDTGREPETTVLREQRIAAARANPRWVEFDKPIRRGPFYVDAADALYARHLGAVFFGGRIEFDEKAELAFYVDGDHNVVMLERVRTPASWSEVVERQARRAARAGSR